MFDGYCRNILIEPIGLPVSPDPTISLYWRNRDRWISFVCWRRRAAGCERASSTRTLHGHNGESETSRLLARRNLDLFDVEGLDAIITNAAGCGSHLKTYDRLLVEDKRYAKRAAIWSTKCKDISEFLVQIGFRAPKAAPAHLRSTN